MAIRWTLSRARVALLLILTACASGGGAPSRQVHSSVRVEPQVTPGPADPTKIDTPPTLPQLPGANQAVMSAAPERRISFLDVPNGTPITTAVAQVAAQLGLGLSVDPEVRGTTNATLRNVTLDSALHELIVRRGYTYQLQGNVLRVVPIRMESQTFRLDYVALSRVGTMSTIVQRRLSSAGTLAGNGQAGLASGLSTQSAGFGGGAAGADVLTGQSVADVWQEIRIILTGILQAGQPSVRTTATDQTAATQTPGGSFSSGATTVSFADGSTLSISPFAGLIHVNAMPEKLREVERFIAEFQASVLRQVMIEAKIVEVTLNKEFQFGIDWKVVNLAGRSGFTLRSDPATQQTGNAGNVSFTISSDNTSINAVLTAFESQGTVKVLSNEKTSALNNQRAIFNVTTDEIFFAVTRTPLLSPTGGVISVQNEIIPQQISVGVVLDVLAQISSENILTMNIRPAVTTIARVDSITLADGTSTSAPVIARREGDTIARLRAGETMIIGGLVQTRKDHTIGGIPFLKDIPLIGKLFQTITDIDNRSELVIFLTPTVLSSQPATGSGGR